MRCPRCREEIAYAPIWSAFFCLSVDCGWKQKLTEDEVFAIFFEPPRSNEKLPCTGRQGNREQRAAAVGPASGG
jgi:hypothetical protein